MNYPSLEKYNEALQAPARAIQDPQLRAGQLRTTGLGLPLALCGGFALTYTVDTGGKRFALRCFHKNPTIWNGAIRRLHSDSSNLRVPTSCRSISSLAGS